MKTVSELGYKKPVGTTAYMGRVADLMQNNCGVRTGKFSSVKPMNFFFFDMFINQIHKILVVGAKMGGLGNWSKWVLVETSHFFRIV